MPDGEAPPNILPFTPLRGPPDRLERQPPYNTEAEQALLGALLIDNTAFERVGELVKPEHFGNAMHGRIFEAVAKLIERGQEASPVTLKGVFAADEALKMIGGDRYLGQLAGAGAILLHIEDYARAVRDLYLRRRLIMLGGEVVDAAYSADLDNPAGPFAAAGQIERAEAQLYELAETGLAGSGFAPIGAAMHRAIVMAEAAYKRDAKIVGVPTGFEDLDRLLGGFHRSDLVILAGRPAMGKTALATDLAFNAACNGETAGFFSLEMADAQLGARVLGGVTKIPSDWVRRGGDLNSGQFDKLLKAQQDYGGLPLWIDDTPALSVPGLRARARRLKRQRGLALVVVDYLQLLQPTRPNGRGEQNRVQEVSEITRGLKALAKELDVPVLALSQLSRAVESRDDKRPLLSDLRDSGSIEQDADVVMFIFREEYYLREPDPADAEKPAEDPKWAAWRDKLAAVRNKTEIIIAKQRNGPVGVVKLHFDHATTRFSNLAKGEWGQ